MQDWFFTNWGDVWHIAVCTVISFIALFLFIRLSGKRTLSNLNAFDFVVSVSMGATLSWMMLKQVSLAEGCMALFLIIGMQFLLAWLVRQSRTLESAINSEPALLFYNGVFLEDAMKRELITREEILSEIRQFRIDKIADVKAVVLELNGELTVVKKSEGEGETSTDEFLPIGS